MISGPFPEEKRARAQAVFAAGMLLGGAAGQALGGIMGQMQGWQRAFFAVGIPGLLLGLAVLRLEEPPREPRSELVPVGRLLMVPAYVMLIFSGVLITFAGVSFLTWGIDYVVNWKDFSLREAAVVLATVALVSLVLGVLAGGYVADRLQKRFAYGRILAVAGAFLLAVPFLLWALAADEKRMVLAAFFMAGFFMSWYHGPVTAVIHDLVPRRAHATSVGIYMFVTQLVGAFGPQLVGKISDLHDLQVGLQVATGIMLLGALSFLLVIYFIRRDGLHHPRLEVYRAEAQAGLTEGGRC
jgi:predicted MFS family arabinose efflux permease